MLAKRALTEEIHHRTLCFPRTTITPCNVHVLSNALVRTPLFHSHRLCIKKGSNDARTNVRVFSKDEEATA